MVVQDFCAFKIGKKYMVIRAKGRSPVLALLAEASVSKHPCGSAAGGLPVIEVCSFLL